MSKCPKGYIRIGGICVPKANVVMRSDIYLSTFGGGGSDGGEDNFVPVIPDPDPTPNVPDPDPTPVIPDPDPTPNVPDPTPQPNRKKKKGGDAAQNTLSKVIDGMSTLDYVSAGLAAGSLVLTSAGIVVYNSGQVVMSASELADEGIEMVDLADAAAEGGESLEALLASTRTGLQAAIDDAQAEELGIVDEGIELTEITEETPLLVEEGAEFVDVALEGAEVAAEIGAEVAVDTAVAAATEAAAVEAGVLAGSAALAPETLGTSLIVGGLVAGSIAAGVAIEENSDAIADATVSAANTVSQATVSAANTVSQEFDKDVKKIGKVLNPFSW
jgi:hypothetical protein